MAGKENGTGGGGVHNFVRSRNPNENGQKLVIPAGTHDFDGFKVHTKLAKARKDQTRTPHAARGRKRSNSDQQPQTDEPRAFYETDPSNIGDTSTAPSVRSPNHSPPPTGHVYAQDNQPDDESSEGSEGSGSEDEDSDAVENEDGFDSDRYRHARACGLNDAQFKLMLRQERMQHVPGMNLPHIKGDTPPVTTSGNPSPEPLDEPQPQRKSRSQKRALHPQQQHHQVQMPPPPTTTPRQHHHQKKSRSASAKRGTEKWSTLHNGLIVRDPEQDLFAQDSNVAFSYGKAQRAGLPLRTAEHGGVYKHGSTNIAHRASTPSLSHTTIQMPQATLQIATALPRGVPIQVETHHSQPQPPLKVEIPPALKQETSANVKKEQFSQENEPITISSTASEESEEPEANVLDYEAPDLFRMQYRDLKGQSFDTDPSGTAFTFHDETPHPSLESKIEAVAKMAPHEQAAFFASLSIDDWEQAGDWFITRFGEVLNKIKAARREKRSATAGFEDQIERRHDVVGKKRKQIDNSLTEMRTSGNKVLQSTPKRARPG